MLDKSRSWRYISSVAMTYFQKILHELMDEYELSQLELSRALSCRQSQVSNWLNGKSKPNYDSLRVLSSFFNVSADMLLDTNQLLLA